MAQGWLCRCGCGSVRDFIGRYNREHRHSRIRFVNPAQRRRGEDHKVLARRYVLYQQARNQHLHRWSGATRNWQLIGTFTLNPEKEHPILKIAP